MTVPHWARALGSCGCCRNGVWQGGSVPPPSVTSHHRPFSELFWTVGGDLWLPGFLLPCVSGCTSSGCPRNPSVWASHLSASIHAGGWVPGEGLGRSCAVVSAPSTWPKVIEGHGQEGMQGWSWEVQSSQLGIRKGKYSQESSAGPAQPQSEGAGDSEPHPRFGRKSSPAAPVWQRDPRMAPPD